MSRAPGVIRCLISLALCDVALRVLGFARTLRIARWLARTARNDGGDALTEQTLRNVLVATAFYPGRSKCLEQAVTTYVLLRRRAVPVEIRLGVQPYPFFAHAWLDLHGRPLTESPEVVARFALMPDPAL